MNVIKDIPEPVTVGLPAPVTTNLAPPVINVPSYEAPTLTPPTVEPAIDPNFGLPRTRNGEASGSEGGRDGLGLPPLDTPGNTIDVLGQEIPVPTPMEVTLAGTTAVASVAAALLGKALVEQLIKIMKPIVKTTILKIKKALGKNFTEEEVQLYFALEKSLEKKLKKEQKKSVLEQRQRQRPNK